MYTVYAISSISRNYIYVGFTSNLEKQLTRHNRGYEKTTRPYAPFKLIYTKTGFRSGELARVHEKYLKSGVGKEFLRSLRS